MRKLVAVLVLALSSTAACQSSARPAPASAVRAEIRFQIARAIATSGEQRAILDVREVSSDTAIVLTAPRGAAAETAREERWVRGGAGWQLASAGSSGDTAAR